MIDSGSNKKWKKEKLIEKSELRGKFVHGNDSKSMFFQIDILSINYLLISALTRTQRIEFKKRKIGWTIS